MTETPTAATQATINMNQDRAVLQRFELEARTRDLAHQAYESWSSGPDVTATDVDGTILASDHYPSMSSAIWEHELGIALIVAEEGRLSVRSAAENPVRAAAIVEAVREIIRPYTPESPDIVPVTFWSYGPMGPQQIRRDLDAGSWEDIACNYPTSAGLEDLMDPDFRAGIGGQLLLWHGEPGTGKTTALRALARQWRDWCDLHYIVDPDAFFGDHASYMMQVMTAPEEAAKASAHARPRWRLLVLEDCGEMLQPDARREVGQALSRLLNACDGLIGRGLRFLVLVTTNEPADKLHEAVSRPGRCAARVEFGVFTRTQASRWLAEHGSDEVASESMTIADLYGRVDGFRRQPQERKIGFAA